MLRLTDEETLLARWRTWRQLSELWLEVRGSLPHYLDQCRQSQCADTGARQAAVGRQRPRIRPQSFCSYCEYLAVVPARERRTVPRYLDQHHLIAPALCARRLDALYYEVTGSPTARRGFAKSRDSRKSPFNFPFVQFSTLPFPPPTHRPVM